MAFNLSASNRSQLAYKLEGVYPTNWGVLQGGNGTNLNMLSETLDPSIKYLQSSSIRADRQIPDAIPIGAGATGGFAFELQFKEYDPFIQGVLQNDFAMYGTNGLSAAIASMTLASGSITAGVAPTGGDAFTTLGKGQWFTIKPPAGATQQVKDYLAGRAFRTHLVTPTTSTVITLDAATPINTTLAGTSIANGFISSAVAMNGTTMKSYTLEVGHLDAVQFRQFFGMIPSKMDLKLSVGGIVTGSFDFMGKNGDMVASTGMGTAAVSQTFTAANATRGIFDIFENGASVTTNTYIKSAEFTIDNSLRAQEAIGNYGNVGIAAGTIKITGKLEVYFADAVMYQKFLKGTSSSMIIPILDVDGNGYVFSFPKIKYTAGKINTGGLDQDNVLSMEFMAVLDPTVAAATFNKTIAVYRV